MNFGKAPFEELYCNSLETWNKKTVVIFRKLRIIFINLIKLYFLGTTQEDLNEPILYLYKFEQLKLCNLSYIKEYEQKFRKYAILAKIDRILEYLNKYILNIQGPIGVRL